MSKLGLIALIAASLFGLQGCLLLVAGGVGEAGYIASDTTVSPFLNVALSWSLCHTARPFPM